MPPKAKFADGERVLCFHGNLLYEAKCVKSEAKEKTVRYFIHYNGWNKNWDEWVPESRVLKFNEAGLQKQRELQRANVGQKAPKGGGMCGPGRGQVGRPKRADKDKDREKDKDKPPTEKEKHRDKEERASTPTVADSRAERAEKRKGTVTASGSDRGGDKGSVAGDRDSRASTPTLPESGSSARDKRKATGEKLSCKTVPDKQLVVVVDTDEEHVNPTVDALHEHKKKRCRMDASVESEDSYVCKLEVRIKVPDELKPWLVDDWDLISRQKKLVSLPCKTTVDSILDDYVKFKLAKGTNPQKDAILEMTQGLRDYFNVMLGTQLLYKFERIQYQETLADHPDVPMCKIYGAIHLLRLFVKLGSMLAYTPLDEKSIHLLTLHIHDFLKYTAKNASTLFNVSDYIIAPPEYHRKSL